MPPNFKSRAAPGHRRELTRSNNPFALRYRRTSDPSSRVYVPFRVSLRTPPRRGVFADGEQFEQLRGDRVCRGDRVGWRELERLNCFTSSILSDFQQVVPLLQLRYYAELRQPPHVAILESGAPPVLCSIKACEWRSQFHQKRNRWTGATPGRAPAAPLIPPPFRRGGERWTTPTQTLDLGTGRRVATMNPAPESGQISRRRSPLCGAARVRETALGLRISKSGP